MKRILALAARSFGAFFGAPMNYVALAVFYVLLGFLFRSYITTARVADLAPFVEQISFLILLVVPVFCMRTVSEELRSGSLNLLWVRGVRSVELVVAKLAAGAIFSLLGVAVPISIATWVMFDVGDPDGGRVVAQLCGLAVVTCMASAIGVAASSATPNPLVAAVMGQAIGLGLWFVDGVGVVALTRNLSVRAHLSGFTTGLLSAVDLTYFVSLTTAAGVLAVAFVRLRRA